MKYQSNVKKLVKPKSIAINAEKHLKIIKRSIATAIRENIFENLKITLNLTRRY